VGAAGSVPRAQGAAAPSDATLKASRCAGAAAHREGRPHGPGLLSTAGLKLRGWYSAWCMALRQAAAGMLGAARSPALLVVVQVRGERWRVQLGILPPP